MVSLAGFGLSNFGHRINASCTVFYLLDWSLSCTINDEDVNEDKEYNKVEDGEEDEKDEDIDLIGFLDNNNWQWGCLKKPEWTKYSKSILNCPN